MPTERIHWSGKDLGKEIPLMGGKLHGAIGKLMQYQAVNGQNYMRSNARWTDRTANARGGLSGASYAETDKFIIVLFHKVPYGIWLEVANSGKYKIIEPAIQKTGADAMRSIQKIMNRIG